MSNLSYKTKHILIAGAIAFMALSTVLMPMIVSAAPPTQIVPNCGYYIDPTTHRLAGSACGWQDVLTLANNILQFLLYIAVPIAAICFAYAGWLYLSARGNPGQITKAHGIFLNVAIGLIIALSAWLVVNIVLTTLANPSNYTPVLKSK